ncbi:hypothetical protein HC766_07800 [Candidatus Gracilibacteria bacterium]|nr:hypothetical protein [Candidatus Gracilibacteria bacterium]
MLPRWPQAALTLARQNLDWRACRRGQCCRQTRWRRRGRSTAGTSGPAALHAP